LDWDAQQAHCPQGHTSVHWRPGRDVSGDPVIRIRFDGPTCRVCPTRQACPSAQAAPRQLTVRPQAHHEAIQAARRRQATAAFNVQYTLRAGVESSLSQGSRRLDLRQSRYRGLARTHLQQLLNATAMPECHCDECDLCARLVTGRAFGGAPAGARPLCSPRTPSFITSEGALLGDHLPNRVKDALTRFVLITTILSIRCRGRPAAIIP
jgi:hypothetical protein